MNRLALLLFMLGESLWLGSSVYFSAFAATELFGRLSEDAAANAIGVLFPTYFLLSAILAVATWLLYLWTARLFRFGRTCRRVGSIAAFIGAVLAVVNETVMLPRVEHIESMMGPISKASAANVQTFGMWHGISMLFDFTMIACALVTLICAALSFASAAESSHSILHR